MATGRRGPRSGEALYERYKDALKRGHVASLRGRLGEALDAYAEASSIAPERPTPHSSAGTALLRRRRPADALAYYEAALSLAPRDETSLLGRAQSLAALDRRAEAADAFDAVAEYRAQAGKLADAVDAARRGLELAEGRDRRRTLERLIARLRASEPGEPGRLALERALGVLEGPAVAGAAKAGPVAAAGADTAGADEPEPAGPGIAAAGEPRAEPEPEPGPSAGPASATEPDEPETGPVAASSATFVATDDSVSAGEGWPPAPAPVPIRSALDRDLADPDPASLARAAEAALDAGDGPEAVERLLDLAAVSRTAGRVDAALDACYRALGQAPDHLGLHLALVELYGDRGWGVLAAEKLDLLDRLVALDGDAEAAERVAATRSRQA